MKLEILSRVPNNKSYESDSFDSINNNVLRDFTVTWSKLNHSAKSPTMKKLINKVRGNQSIGEKPILSNCNGSFKSGRLTAIMGPSGAGKSTLIECLAGFRQAGPGSEIRLSGSHVSRVTLALVPQVASFYESLTVRETVKFAFKLQQYSRIVDRDQLKWNFEKLESKVDQILSSLHINHCANQQIWSLSGGEKKRLQIAQELVSLPDILIMDEPTSGLDSTTCYQLIQLFIKLASESSTAIVITIHQPGFQTFNILQDIYMLSKSGQIIYKGQANQMKTALSYVGIKCSPHENPVDVMLDVAIGKYGVSVINKLIKLPSGKNKNNKFRQSDLDSSYSRTESKPLLDNLVPSQGAFKDVFSTLFHRFLRAIYYNTESTVVRFIFTFGISIILGTLWYKSGQADGCFDEETLSYLTMGQFDLAQADIFTRIVGMMLNLGSFYMLLVVITFTSMIPIAVILPSSKQLILNEHHNKWYNHSIFLVSMMAADLIFLISCSTFTATIHYLMTFQPLERFGPTLLIILLHTMLSQIWGALIGTICFDSLFISITSTTYIIVPFTVSTGFVISYEKLTSYIYTLLYNVSFIRISLDAIMVSVFGMNRCSVEVVQLIKKTMDEIETFLNMIFKVAITSIQRLTSETESQALTNQTEILVKSITNRAFGGIKMDENGQSLVIGFFGLMENYHSRAILILVGYISIGFIFSSAIFKYQVNRKS